MTINKYKDAEEEGKDNIFTLYESNIGILTPMIADRLKDIENTYPKEWIKEAIDIACQNNIRKLNYINSILENWQAKGFKSGINKKKPQEPKTKKYSPVN